MFIPFSIAITFPAVMQSQTIHRRENLLQTTHLLYWRTCCPIPGTVLK